MAKKTYSYDKKRPIHISIRLCPPPGHYSYDKKRPIHIIIYVLHQVTVTKENPLKEIKRPTYMAKETYVHSKRDLPPLQTNGRFFFSPFTDQRDTEIISRQRKWGVGERERERERWGERARCRQGISKLLKKRPIPMRKETCPLWQRMFSLL